MNSIALKAGNFFIDRDLTDFIVQVANSSLKTEILDFVYYHPSGVVNSYLIAKKIGRKERHVEEALSEMSEYQLLRPVNGDISGTYNITDESKFKNLLDRFVKLFDNREGRHLLSSVISKAGTGSRYTKRN